MRWLGRVRNDTRAEGVLTDVVLVGVLLLRLKLDLRCRLLWLQHDSIVIAMKSDVGAF